MTDLPESKALSAGNCSATINPILNSLLGVNPIILKQVGLRGEERKKTFSNWLTSLFEARNKMRARVSELVKGGASDPCLTSVRKYLVYNRFAEEVITETMVNEKFFAPQDADGNETAFRGAFPATMTSAKYKDQPRFKAGDVMLDRGDSALSAQIARIGDVEHMYSHAMIVGADPQGKLYVIETTVEDVVKAIPLKKYMDDNADSRMAIYRPIDEQSGVKAGRFMYDFVESNRRKGVQFRYDYHMKDQDASEFFCSEVPQFAYKKSSGGKIMLPMYKTDVGRFDVMGSNNWVKRMGIDEEKIYSPADIDVDPRFNLVSEYRYVPELRPRRVDDAAMTSMYDWMLNKGYSFMGGFALGDQLMIQGVKLFGGGMVPENMPLESIRAALEFDRAFELVHDNLEKKEKAYFAENGMSMSFRQMLAENESFRQKDCVLYQNNVLARADEQSSGSGDSKTYFHLTMESSVCR